MSFATPAPRTDDDTERKYFQLRNYKGALLAFKVTGYDPAHVNPHFAADGAKPTIYADVTVIDGPDAGREWPSVEITAQYVVPRLEPNVGKVTLARVGKGQRAFFLDDPEPADVQLAEEVFAQRGHVPDDEPPF